MSKTVYQRTALTGGGTALDGIDGNTLNDGDVAIVFVTGYTFLYLLDDDSGASESSPDVISPDTNPGNKRWVRQDTGEEGTVNVKWFGTTAANLATAIAFGCGHKLRWPAGTYSPLTKIDVTMTGDSHWVADGPVLIQYAGAAADYRVFQIELDSYDFTMEGPFTIDCNNLARIGLRINNDVGITTMAEAADLYMRNVKAINAYSALNSYDAIGIIIYGAFNKIKLDHCGAANINRAAALTGSPGSFGICYANGGINKYARQVVITDPYIDTVTAADAAGDGTYVNMDGIIVTGPSADDNSGVKMDTTLIVRGGTLINCSGRSIKTQMESNLIDGPTFIKNSTMSKMLMASGDEVDFQYGSGILTNYKCRYSALSGSGTPFPASWSICNGSVRAYANEEGALVVTKGEIVNDVPQATDAMPYLVTFATVAGTYQAVDVSENTFLGQGKLDVLVYGDLSQINRITVDNNFTNDLTTALVYSTTAAGNCRLNASGNYNSGTARSLLSSAADPKPLFSGFGNVGFSEYTGAYLKNLIVLGSSGGFARTYVEATATLSGASTTITLSIPTGARLLGTQLRVDTLITGAGGATTWNAAYSGGATATIATGLAFTKNTSTTVLFDENAATPITSNTTNIAVTPNAGTFTAGVVRAITFYEYYLAMDSAP